MIERGLGRHGIIVLALMFALAGTGPANSPRGNSFQLTGTTLSASGSSVVEQSLFIFGEPLAGRGQNAFFTLEVGAAPIMALAGAPATPGDADGDGDVDLADYESFVDCMNGPEMSPNPPPPQTAQGCVDVFDFDAEGDVDLADYAGFQAAFTG